ncbi:nitrogenase molybdenum-iron protein alpha chain [Desulfonatronospira sp. MSAO_Bac3]|uniref:nitrogenase molybdenum-iron protein alpha chain n=1 Tax=Desulfonatronospira sp. MSAO_Bac3 TaxID=2293857 RepID=UPI000FF3D39E|nr:nitrogenase molybdenum-iron protein alpha chain [Desulfonatronospira sp. MSAO_Bac3]RQD77615.1 MAG: nitrogenase molybdenum-iron protein alpha chain [Desulfonatronospira sp. MSAO_Bac3]
MSDLKSCPSVDLEEFVDNILKKYPAKVAKKRKDHILVRKEEDPARESIQANNRTVPGIITQRGCCYAGCKGVVLGPVGDMVHITHGPIGCGFYAWLTRRNLFKPGEDGKNYSTYCFSTDMQEQDIIFGGEKKLKQAIKEAWETFKPNAISVHATCPVGLIGDDVQAVAREAEAELGVKVLAFNCEGYKGVSQSAGHHIANNKLFNETVGTKDEAIPGYSVNILGEYNIGGDAWEIERILEKCGIKIAATFSGDGKYDSMTSSHMASLNLIMCYRSINYLAEMMETKYGIPWAKVNFIGVKAMSKSLRKIARFFEDPELTRRIEEVIKEEEESVEQKLAPYRERLQGKTAMLFVGGSRAHHYQDLLRDLGMEPVAAGYEFAHRDDYEGSHIAGKIKVDADSRNIEELKVEPDSEKYSPRVSPEKKKELEQESVLGHYHGMIPDMPPGTLVVDDISHLELEELIKTLKPDIILSGIKDKYVIEKFNVPSKQIHNYDYSGPFAGYKGAVNFARDIDMMINNPAWKLAVPPFEKKPLLSADLGTD